MGRIKTQLAKRITNKIINLHSDKLNNEFDKNKKVVSEFTDIKSKKLRNIIAGYASRLIKAKN